MKIQILASVMEDLEEGFRFYESQQSGVGSYFLSSISADINRLHLTGGIHPIGYRDFHRSLCRTFPFGIYYKAVEEVGALMNKEVDADEMRDEYDFSGGVRGKHIRDYRAGHTVRITREDGTVEERHFTLEDGAVMLDPDLRAKFPDSDAVNKALRSLV